MRVVDVVARCLHQAGVDTVFGVVGSGNFTVTVSLHALGARFVAARHENGAVCMADAYTRVSGRLGCVSVHQGPGLTNAMTGLTEAAKGRTPLVLVAADTPAGEVRSNFFVEQAKLAEAVGAVPVRAERPVIVAGRGAVLANAREPLEALSHALGAPIATSAMGHGLFAGHPFALGISGGFASPLAAEIIGARDLVLAFGARTRSLAPM